MSKSNSLRFKRSMPRNNKAVTKHIKRMGEICYCWNELHVCLMLIFSSMIERGNPDKGMAIWNALTNDKNKRDMLAKLAAQQLDKESSIYKNIIWIKNKTDTLGMYRNAFVHSPATATFAATETHKIKIEAVISNKEFSNLRGDLLVLKDYALSQALHFFLPSLNYPDVEKPSLKSVIEANSQDTQKENRRKKQEKTANLRKSDTRA